ncbi:LacI family repressor for deo operon, udp, cdd, tsx, nupC, and nupG [Litorivivens lipolytica]|uniref:LacI family repressor for deo operon, udp, cdd, tsx, nupC, and nupG n=1 Tax=Litorivivens lipolytica TaxID=1524264 RepID=A0A7W4Z665_9GAMM|nr:LacI family DNA-binding transcriptional regulator [Litorivivens lipolytica]MBB3047928.1 LacI family repressor for deo operon, udp, cdd, tsx, nupC, and nupG [Litorivivens lipolytica]
MVTIKDVAKMAGVSIATVSRTLAEPEKVSEKTRAKVMKAVESSGYVTNTLARNFRRRRSNMVVVLVPDIANPFFSNIIQGIERVARRHQYRILLGDTQGDVATEKAYADLVSQRQADGVICLGRNIPFAYKKGRKTVDPNWPPFAMACEYHGDIPVPTVCIDNVAAARDAVNHLLSLGHRHIGFINGPEDSPLCEDRLIGYRQALKAAKVKTQAVFNGDFSLQSGYDRMNDLLKRGDFTAVFCANDEMAIGALQACRDAGLKPPEDMSVVGFDDIAFAEYTHPRLTSIHQPRNRIGEQVMNLMLSMLAGNAPDTPRLVLPHELVVRESSVAKVG